MGKNKHKHRNNPPPVVPTKSSPQTVGAAPSPFQPATPVEAARQIDMISSQADSLMTEDDLNNPPALPATPAVSEIDLPGLWKKAHEAKELFERAKTRADDAELSAQQREKTAKEVADAVHKREEELRLQKEEHRKIQREFDERKMTLDRREKELVQAEEKLKEREIDAEAGFLQQRRQALAKLDEEAKGLAQQITDHHQSYLESIKKYESELREIRAKELAGIEEGTQQLQLEKQSVARLKREAEWAKQEAEEIKANWVARVEEKVLQVVAERESRLQSALARCKDLGDQLSRYEETERVASGKTREQLLSELSAVRDHNAKLVSELARKPGDDQVAQLRNLESEKETLLSDMGRLRQENQTLQIQLGKLSIGVAEMQNLRDQKSAWESRERALRACVEDLQRELGELVDKSKAQGVFPSLTAMDDNPELQTPPERGRERITSLKTFVEEIRNRIGLEKLFYRDEDVRAFLAGLATSRLHLLQGISGTGKTSLPRAFARAIGARSEIVEVQSGWRDRNDLLGYYNAFERRYYESEFLQALYRAQQPQYSNNPCLIVLDEMNLSHPEHYFADFLSALEQRPNDQRISLLTAKVDGAPRLLEEFRWLRIPPNVWFIGTANHDETTKDFADKTYDRSHVMEFPRHPEAFTATPQNSPVPVTMGALEQAFQKAKETHGEVTIRAKSFFESSLAITLAKLGIGWGNRLERQMESFIPVVVASGGSLGEAVDHLVATKLLRKLRGRFDIGANQLKEFQEHMIKSWDALEKNQLPEKCCDLLERETKRLSGGSA